MYVVKAFSLELHVVYNQTTYLYTRNFQMFWFEQAEGRGFPVKTPFHCGSGGFLFLPPFTWDGVFHVTGILFLLPLQTSGIRRWHLQIW